jgi:hypothetical protein
LKETVSGCKTIPAKKSMLKTIGGATQADQGQIKMRMASSVTQLWGM